MNTNDPLPSGVWSNPDKEHPDQPSIMWIDPARRRIVSLAVIKDPLKQRAMLVWYESESSTSIRIRRTKPDSLEENYRFRLEPDQLIWIHLSYGEMAGKRLSPAEYPGWLEEKVAAAYAKMDEGEREAGQSKTE